MRYITDLRYIEQLLIADGWQPSKFGQITCVGPGLAWGHAPIERHERVFQRLWRRYQLHLCVRFMQDESDGMRFVDYDLHRLFFLPIEKETTGNFQAAVGFSLFVAKPAHLRRVAKIVWEANARFRRQETVKFLRRNNAYGRWVRSIRYQARKKQP